MAVAITCVKVTKGGGRASIEWSDGLSKEFHSVAAAREFVRDTLTIDVLKAIAIAKYLEADPDINNPSLLEGRTITGDLTINNIVRVT